jgi:hypothetical protein
MARGLEGQSRWVGESVRAMSRAALGRPRFVYFCGHGSRYARPLPCSLSRRTPTAALETRRYSHYRKLPRLHRCIRLAPPCHTPIPARVGRLALPPGARACTRFDGSTRRDTTPTTASTDPMTTIYTRSPLQSLPMATNRTTTRRRSARQAFDDDDAPAPKRAKADTKKTNGASGAAKKAAKVAYDEDDDGFQFSRRTSRRTTKAQAVPAQDPIPEHQEAKPAAKPVSRRKKSTVPVPEPEPVDFGRRRRSARISGDRENLEMRPKSTEPVAPKRARKSMAPEKEKRKAVTPAPEAKPDQTRSLARVQTPTRDENMRDANTKRIMLPFADTPVITRNKEMRKGNKDGHRRSSTGLRGRRASSLIDSGMSNGKFASGTDLW